MNLYDIYYQHWIIRAVALGVTGGFLAYMAPYVKDKKLRRICWWIAVGAGLTSAVSVIFGIIQLVK